ncbi:MAG TPA: hypothetical protein VNQ77_13220 [Frankiaceae bacterium]|nr:hypothetical protein [Frankiaceae bacterium]
MRRLAVALVLAGGALASAPAANAGLYCADVLGIEGSGYGPVCTVTCAASADPHVDPDEPDVRGQLPPCLFTD